MPTSKSNIGIIVPCHNEDLYLERCLKSIFNSLSMVEARGEVLVILDRCSDRSPEIANEFKLTNPNIEILTKQETKWHSSIAENFELGLTKFKDCDYISIIDADVVIPLNFFSQLIQELQNNVELVSVASSLETERSTSFNKFYSIYERLFSRISLGESLRGGCRIYRGSAVRRAYDEGTPMIGDYYAQDTKFDQRLGGKRQIVGSVHSLHIRRISFSKCVRGQLSAGRARRQLHSSFLKTLLHSIFRLRPLVIAGYLRYHDSN